MVTNLTSCIQLFFFLATLELLFPFSHTNAHCYCNFCCSKMYYYLAVSCGLFHAAALAAHFDFNCAVKYQLNYAAVKEVISLSENFLSLFNSQCSVLTVRPSEPSVQCSLVLCTSFVYCQIERGCACLRQA